MNRKKVRIAASLFGKKKRVSNKEVSVALGIGTNGVENFLKPLGFTSEWEVTRDAKGNKRRQKVWIQ